MQPRADPVRRFVKRLCNSGHMNCRNLRGAIPAAPEAPDHLFSGSSQLMSS